MGWSPGLRQKVVGTPAFLSMLPDSVCKAMTRKSSKRQVLSIGQCVQGADSGPRVLSGCVTCDYAYEIRYFDSSGESFQTVLCARLL